MVNENQIVDVSEAKTFIEANWPNDPLLKRIVFNLLDKLPMADVSLITSAEKQAIFRLGQMDMRDSMAAMLRDAANRSRGMVRSDFMAAADLVAEREIP